MNTGNSETHSSLISVPEQLLDVINKKQNWYAEINTVHWKRVNISLQKLNSGAHFPPSMQGEGRISQGG